MSKDNKLPELRIKLDVLDDELIALLHSRAALALEVRDTKKRDALSVYAPEREQGILEKVANLATQGPFPAKQLERIFLDILSATRSLVGDMQVSFLGPRFSVADFAARAKFGEHVQYITAFSLAEVFSRVERAESACGVVPISSSSNGLAARTFGLLIDSDVEIIAEVEVSEQLALFSAAETLKEVEKVYASPESFEHARAWLAAHCAHAEREITDDLAAVHEQLNDSPASAIIALNELAEVSNVPLLASGLEPDGRGHARCVVIGQKSPQPSGRDKTSIICAVSERAGALREILLPFSDEDVTLLRIESRPMRNRSGEFVFLIDIAGHREDESCKRAIERLRALSSWMKVAGSYPLVCES